MKYTFLLNNIYKKILDFTSNFFPPKFNMPQELTLLYIEVLK